MSFMFSKAQKLCDSSSPPLLHIRDFHSCRTPCSAALQQTWSNPRLKLSSRSLQGARKLLDASDLHGLNFNGAVPFLYMHHLRNSPTDATAKLIWWEGIQLNAIATVFTLESY